MHTTIQFGLTCLLCWCTTSFAFAGYFLNGTGGLSGGARWNADLAVIAGNERSLEGGLRYSVSGASFQSYRDQFSWVSTPSVADFQQAVEQAFAAWTTVDPVSQLGTTISFVRDFGTQVATGSSFGTLNQNGAEIDLIASDAGVGGLGGLTTVSIFAIPVTLTSGTPNYSGSSSLAGVDIHINSNPGALYTLDAFRRILTHEIGHSIGLNDVDLGAPFIDDNYNSLNSVATLNNSWAALVNAVDPANSAGLSVFNIDSSVFATPGINLLMESNGLGVGAGNPLTNLFPLSNDEFGMRQFLYPIIVVPEPTQLFTFGIVFGSLLPAARTRLRRLIYGGRSRD